MVNPNKKVLIGLLVILSRSHNRFLYLFTTAVFPPHPSKSALDLITFQAGFSFFSSRYDFGQNQVSINVGGGVLSQCDVITDCWFHKEPSEAVYSRVRSKNLDDSKSLSEAQ